jgi:copper(I)-binding protein
MTKKTKFQLILILAISVSLMANCKESSTHDSEAGSGMVIEDARIRLVPPGANVSAGYVKITNHGEPDRLLSAESTLSKTVELHEMKESEGMMKMRKLENGIAIDSHQSATLKPGADHIMFIGLISDLKAGQKVQVSLNFEKSGKKDVEFTVTEIENQMESDSKL